MFTHLHVPYASTLRIWTGNDHVKSVRHKADFKFKDWELCKNMKVNVLGTTYTLEERTLEEDKRLYNKDGYFDYTTNECVVIKEIPKSREFLDEFNEVGDFQKYKSKVKRHELIHAFLKESGVGDTFWGSSEDVVNWLSEQFPKMASAFLKANCLDVDRNYEY